MRHGKKNRKFGRETKQRKELLRDLARALILNTKINTTQAKAKSLRPYIEKLVTKAKDKNLASFKLLSAELGRPYAKKLHNEIVERFPERHGGYTRIINLPSRISDGSKMATIEFLQ
ncbi:MAG: 50S ribosomal protein L17 [Candidatus Yanofskybacteria bacterium RIFCSPHIGHO2_01_FULL_44_17]|uniref:50S ribosomal protein L17 n=1 Tax=Candidatus Yanofskybacteria bacterium RIFCSPHIGHO2_01_FULL_44_17 TaxID=1802668 RepID=A0A1F8EZ11_9BACT|nr:MAG: 50S ribosomal protein L17 [Candidatus Yanofskybacteria bacterium RIFCSPHIGHO2_01_FULL_44_17]